jgi:hypothetical protein
MADRQRTFEPNCWLRGVAGATAWYRAYVARSALPELVRLGKARRLSDPPQEILAVSRDEGGGVTTLYERPLAATGAESGDLGLGPTGPGEATPAEAQPPMADRSSDASESPPRRQAKKRVPRA